MATLARQPFAPLDGARLQTLTSLKNRQNAINTSVKRKASEVLDTDNSENVDPSFFSKRSKGVDSFFASNDLFKPSSSFHTAKASSTASLSSKDSSYCTPPKPASTSLSRPRTVLQAKAPTARLNTSVAKSSPLTAPAGRSPTRGSKRIGILSRRRTARIDPPAFGLGASAPFSLDAALKGTIPSYTGGSSSSSRNVSNSAPTQQAAPSLHDGSNLSRPLVDDASDMKSSWFFDIHEDTPEQEMTNLLQHGTCTLDISSDEESEQRARRERAEGRDKENIPPADDVSQTSSAARAAAAARSSLNADDMVVEKARGPLVEMNATDYYADGCDDSTIVIVPGDEDDAETDAEGLAERCEPEEQAQEEEAAVAMTDADDAVEFSAPSQSQSQSQPDLDLPPDVMPADELADAPAPVAVVDSVVEEESIDVIMGCKDEPAAKAAVLQPIDGTGESFELWESSSARDDAEMPGLPAATVAPAEAAVASAAC